VFHWFEMCDAVQAEIYEIDGVPVSNFLLPLYFTGTRDVDEVGARNDFLGRSHGGSTLRSFGINPGGYIGFFDPETEQHETFSIRADAVAAMRLEAKARAKQARRSVRYRNFAAREQLRQMASAAAAGAKRRAATGTAVARARAATGTVVAHARAKRDFAALAVPAARPARAGVTRRKKK
jgi:hypothetical protein